MTAAVWTRGILGEQYGVHWSEMHWVVSGPQRFSVLEGVNLRVVDLDLETEVIEGRIDAMLTPTPRDETLPRTERRLRSLIANVQEAEEAYVRDYGVYPINHVIVVREDALTRLPQLPQALFQAYAESKARAHKRRLGTTLMPWGMRHWIKVFDQFDGDPLPYGLTPLNCSVISRLARFVYDQKLASRELAIEELFLPHCRNLTQ
jgi:4,5-dihydroxyphthalate decarboxylase